MPSLPVTNLPSCTISLFLSTSHFCRNECLNKKVLGLREEKHVFFLQYHKGWHKLFCIFTTHSSKSESCLHLHIQTIFIRLVWELFVNKYGRTKMMRVDTNTQLLWACSYRGRDMSPYVKLVTQQSLSFYKTHKPFTLFCPDMLLQQKAQKSSRTH